VIRHLQAQIPTKITIKSSRFYLLSPGYFTAKTMLQCSLIKKRS